MKGSAGSFLGSKNPGNMALYFLDCRFRTRDTLALGRRTEVLHLAKALPN